MVNESIRVSIKFFTEIKGYSRDEKGRIDAPENYKLKIMKNIQELLNGGMTEKDLVEALNLFMRTEDDYKSVYSIDDVLFVLGIEANKKAVQKDPNNLIENGVFYYHPQLQLAPPPPTIRQLDDGSFVSSYEEEPFYLEMKTEYTYEDITNYFYSVMGIAPRTSTQKERDIGAFKYICKSYDIDTILYTIDESRALAEDYGRNTPKSPLDIQDYIQEGTFILEERQNVCYMEGLNHVIPRLK